MPTVKTTLRELPDDHRIEFFQDVLYEEGKLLCAGRVVLYFLKASTRQKTIMPEAMRQELLPFFQ